jgi:hypothetical protein
MKKICSFIIILFVVVQVNAQFFNSIGLTAGLSLGNQKFFFSDPSSIARKKYILGYNASFFGEFFSHDHFRWVSEIQYNQKGSIDKQPEGKYRNKLHYLCWNNYLKVRIETYRVIPYLLIGPRLEYTLAQNTASPPITSNFTTLHASAAAGAGLEFVSFINFKFLVEGFYNPDILSAYKRSGLQVRNKNLELRVGLKYEFAGRKERCNTPTYVE